MKKNTKLEEKITKHFNKWKKKLFLDGTFVELRFSYEANENDAECSFRYPYIDNVITVYMRNIKEKECEKIILHELLHVITDRLYNTAYSRFITKEEIEKERENLTDTLTSIIYKLNETS